MTKKRLIATTATIYIILITLLSLLKLSIPEVNPKILGFDKIVHFCFYFGFNALIIITLIAYKVKSVNKWLILTTLIAILYGVAIEFIQKYVDRDFDIYDIVANSIGAISAAIIISHPQINKMLNKYISKHI